MERVGYLAVAMRPTAPVHVDPRADVLLTVKDAAVLLKWSIRSVQRAIAGKKLQAFHIADSRSVRVRRADVERLLNPTITYSEDDLAAFIAERSA